MASFDSQSVYNPLFLKFYDFYVLAFSNRCAWRCPKQKVLQLYKQHLSAKHLEAGVGSGYFLDHCTWPVAKPDLTLLDLNPNCLEYAGQRIARFQPRKVLSDLLQPLPSDIGPFQSIALNYVLHCIQGDLKQKASIFDNLQKVLAPNGKLFGATILNLEVSQNFLSRQLIKLYNKQGVFGNVNDSLSDLKTVLQQRFNNVSLEVSGNVALFSAF